MSSSATQQKKVSEVKPPPLKERLWNIFGILFYITVAVGAVYHLIPLFKP
jgi:hypothetical protein